MIKSGQGETEPRRSWVSLNLRVTGRQTLSPRDPGQRRHIPDPLAVPVLAGVDQEGLAVRHGQQRRVGRLHVDLVDAQGLRAEGNAAGTSYERSRGVLVGGKRSAKATSLNAGGPERGGADASRRAAMAEWRPSDITES